MQLMEMPAIRVLALAGISAVFSGCASMFINGGELSGRDLAPKAERHYKIGTCINLISNSSTEVPSATYHALQHEGKPALFERGVDGTGTLITNQWEDAGRHHFLTWVKSTGWEFVLPKEVGQPAERLVHVPLAFEEVGGAVRATSKPVVRCVLTPANR